MVRTSGLWIILLIACINGAEYRRTKDYSTRAQVLSVDVKSLHQDDNGAIVAGEPSQLIIFGKYLQENIQLILTNKLDTAGGSCSKNYFKIAPLIPYKYLLLSDYIKLFVYIPQAAANHMNGDSHVWLCYRTDKLSNWIHFGENSKIPIRTRQASRRHLLRRSLIDDKTPPVRNVSIEAKPSGASPTSEHARQTDQIGRESDKKNTTTPSLIEKISDSVTSDEDDFRTSDNKRSVGGVDDEIASNVPTSFKPTMTMSLLEEKYSTEILPHEKQLSFGSNAWVSGIRIEDYTKDKPLQENSVSIRADYDAYFRIFGYGLTNKVQIQFTAKEQKFGTVCDVSTSDVFQLNEVGGGGWATLKINLPAMSVGQERWYLCVRQDIRKGAIHQGEEKWLTVITYTLPIPLWVQIGLISILLLLSGLFSGLNLGLMSLDKTELKVVLNTGTTKERSYARAIEPVRRHGNFLLCTLLLGNVMVNSTFTILLDSLSTGLIAVIGSTIGIVIFGEIVPQAICSRHGLAIGAKTVWLVRIFMVVTGIIAWPVSKILDKVLGEELGNTYNRERLKELIRVTQDSNDIKLEEQNIICGALELHRKTVREVMTKIEDVFMLNVDVNLDFNTINDIMEQGYSRVPIYESDRMNIISVLFIKDLAFIDPDDNTPLRTLSKFYQNPCLFIFEDTTLDVVFKEFKEGNKGHMAFVQRIHNDGDCDPYYELVGLITLEDVIEELIQEEIIDETDVYIDNRTKRKRKFAKRRDFKEFYQANNPAIDRSVSISPQMQVAALQFLRTSVDQFKEEYISEGILKKLLTQDIIHVIKPSMKGPEQIEQAVNIYVQGSPSDFFILILEGHVEVTIGKENLNFESGPFSFFGCSALSGNQSVGESPSLPNQLSRGSIQSLETTKISFLPDFTVKVISEVTFLKLRRSHYVAARRACLVQKIQKDPQAMENFEKEIAEILSNEQEFSLSFFDSSDKEASVKDTLLNGGALSNCNGMNDKTVRSSDRSPKGKIPESLTSTPKKENKQEDPTETPQNAEDC